MSTHAGDPLRTAIELAVAEFYAAGRRISEVPFAEYRDRVERLAAQLRTRPVPRTRPVLRLVVDNTRGTDPPLARRDSTA